MYIRGVSTKQQCCCHVNIICLCCGDFRILENEVSGYLTWISTTILERKLVLVYNFLEHPQGVHSYDYSVALNQCSGWNNIYNIFEDEMMDSILANDSLQFVLWSNWHWRVGCVAQPLPNGRVQVQQQRIRRIILLIQR